VQTYFRFFKDDKPGFGLVVGTSFQLLIALEEDFHPV
jgi:hypothetical protein